MKIKKQNDNFRLSALEILSANPNDLEGVKKQLIRSLIRKSRKKRLCIPTSLYKPLVVHFDTLLSELYVQDAKGFIERLNSLQKVYMDEIYTFIMEHFHELSKTETIWKIMVILEQYENVRG